MLDEFKRLNDLWNRATQANQPMNPEEQPVQPTQMSARPVQTTYAEASSQFPMTQNEVSSANPYGDYSALRSRMQANQTPTPTPQAFAPGTGTSGPANGKVSAAISAGQKYIGNSKYVWGGGRKQSDIENGRFDCSGFVNYAFAEAGVNLGGGNTDTIAKRGVAVSPDQMQPGDIVFFDTYKKNGHVGIYIGNGKFIGSQSKTGVAVADMTSGYFAKKFNGYVRRV